MDKRDEMFAKMPGVIGRAIAKALVESKPIPSTSRRIYKKRHRHSRLLTLAVWVGWPLFIAIVMGLLIIFAN